MKRVISVLLALWMMLTVMPVGIAEQTEDHALKGAVGKKLLEKASVPEDQPYLALYVEYEKTDQYCTTHAKATLLHVNNNGKADNPAAEDLIIELKTEDTLELVEGSNYHVFFDELSCGGEYTFEFDLFCEFPTETVEKAPEPKLTITVKSSNVGGCQYTCTFDSTTEPRSIVMGWDIEGKTPNAIKNDLGMMNELFGKSYYNKQLVDMHSYYNHPNGIDLLRGLSELETDENDITYVYVNAHGTTAASGKKVIPGFFAFAPGNDVTVDGVVYVEKNVILYNQLFLAFHERIKGRVVVILDICFSGIALDKMEGAGFEEEQYSLLTSVNDKDNTGTYEYAEGYGWFTKELYDEFSGRIGQPTVGDVYAHMRKHADTHLGLLGWGTVDPQFSGNADEFIFCFDEEAWMKDPEFIVVEESLVCGIPPSVIVMTETTVEEGERFSGTIVRPKVYADVNENLKFQVDAALQEEYEKALADIERWKAVAAECDDDHAFEHYANWKLSGAYCNGGVLLLKMTRSMDGCGIGHSTSSVTNYLFDVATGEQLEFTDLIDWEKNPLGDLCFGLLIGKCLEAGGESKDKAVKAYEAMLEGRGVSWRFTPEGISLGFDYQSIDILCDDQTIPYENLRGIFKDEYIPQKSQGEAEVENTLYTGEDTDEYTLVYDNTPAVNELEVSGYATHLWVADGLGRTLGEATGRCSCFYAYGLGSSVITLPEPLYEEYGYNVIWVDEKGFHEEHLPLVR